MTEPTMKTVEALGRMQKIATTDQVVAAFLAQQIDADIATLTRLHANLLSQARTVELEIASLRSIKDQRLEASDLPPSFRVEKVGADWVLG